MAAGTIDLFQNGGEVVPASEGGGFVALTRGMLADLAFMTRQTWRIDSSGELVGPDRISLDPGFRLRIGALAIDLAQPLSFQVLARRDDGGILDMAVVVGDGWRIDRLRLHRPLIYYAAFGAEEIFEQLQHSLQSLHEFGGYAGEVHVLSDRPRGALEPYVPHSLSPHLTASAAVASCPMEFILARYRITDWPPSGLYQPLVYTDTDVVFDAPIDPLLRAITQAERLCAVREDFASLSDQIGSGCRLFRADGLAPPPDARGFNAGQLGIPNLARCEPTLRLIAGVAGNAFERDRAGDFPYYDQPFANYVCYKLGEVDIDTISPFCDIGHGGRHIDASRRRGSVHFWPFMTKHDKRNAMAIYINTVRAAMAVG